eukprot:jgi/Chlat1/7213/Chrsp57S06865
MARKKPKAKRAPTTANSAQHDEKRTFHSNGAAAVSSNGHGKGANSNGKNSSSNKKLSHLLVEQLFGLGGTREKRPRAAKEKPVTYYTGSMLEEDDEDPFSERSNKRARKSLGRKKAKEKADGSAAARVKDDVEPQPEMPKSPEPEDKKKRKSVSRKDKTDANGNANGKGKHEVKHEVAGHPELSPFVNRFQKATLRYAIAEVLGPAGPDGMKSSDIVKAVLKSYQPLTKAQNPASSVTSDLTRIFARIGPATYTLKEFASGREVHEREGFIVGDKFNGGPPGSGRPTLKGKGQKSSVCHQCFRNAGSMDEVVHCSTCEKARGYCKKCLERWYPNLSTEQAAEKCPRCLHTCNCNQCIREKPALEDRTSYSPEQKAAMMRHLLHAVQPALSTTVEEQEAEEQAAQEEEEVEPVPQDERLYWGQRTLRLRRTLAKSLLRELKKAASDPESLGEPPSLSAKECPWCSKLQSDSQSARVERPRNRWVEEVYKSIGPDAAQKHALFRPHISELQADDGDTLLHFQWHWSKGEPVVVQGLLDNRSASALSWDPQVMARAIYHYKGDTDSKTITSIDCHDLCEVDMGVHMFFNGYKHGWWSGNGKKNEKQKRKYFKLKDWPPKALFDERLPRHFADFVRMLPYQEYTNPIDGIFNLATYLPEESVRPDLGPKSYVAYGCEQEFDTGNSATKLHCDMSDAVNVVMHSCDPYGVYDKTNEAYQQKKAGAKKTQGNKGTKHKKGDEDADESRPAVDSAGKSRGDKGKKIRKGVEELDESRQDAPAADSAEPAAEDNSEPQAEPDTGAAVWDIFKREDVENLKKYLVENKHRFTHLSNQPIEEVVHPIHDQTFFLTVNHLKELQEQYNVVPWRFIQYDGEAVFIPAGCPHQVRNLKSCIKVAMDFVSPESVSECIKLTAEFRKLPHDHRAKEDKLQVKLMVLHAADQAVKELQSCV